MAFPRSQRRKAWQTFVDLIKNNPLISREVKTFRTWRGDTRDQGKESTRQYPYLLMEAQSEESSWEDSDTIHADVLVDVEIAMNGVDPGDLMDFWDAIQRAIFPNNAARLQIEQALYEVGIYAVTLEQAGFGVMDEDSEGGPVLRGMGRIKLTRDEQLKGF